MRAELAVLTGAGTLKTGGPCFRPPVPRLSQPVDTALLTHRLDGPGSGLEGQACLCSWREEPAACGWAGAAARMRGVVGRRLVRLRLVSLGAWGHRVGFGCFTLTGTFTRRGLTGGGLHPGGGLAGGADRRRCRCRRGSRRRRRPRRGSRCRGRRGSRRRGRGRRRREAVQHDVVRVSRKRASVQILDRAGPEHDVDRPSGLN